MTTDDDTDCDEADVPALAVEALAAAQRRARAAGHPLVQVQDGQLVRIEGAAVTVLKRLPGRQRVQSPPVTAQ